MKMKTLTYRKVIPVLALGNPMWSQVCWCPTVISLHYTTHNKTSHGSLNSFKGSQWSRERDPSIHPRARDRTGTDGRTRSLPTRRPHQNAVNLHTPLNLSPHSPFLFFYTMQMRRVLGGLNPSGAYANSFPPGPRQSFVEESFEYS